MGKIQSKDAYGSTMNLPRVAKTCCQMHILIRLGRTKTLKVHDALQTLKHSARVGKTRNLKDIGRNM